MSLDKNRQSGAGFCVYCYLAVQRTTPPPLASDPVSQPVSRRSVATIGVRRELRNTVKAACHCGGRAVRSEGSVCCNFDMNRFYQPRP